MMTAPQDSLNPRLRSLLAALRRSIRAYVWLEGIAIAVVWLGLTFWAGLAIDYLPVLAGSSEMPRAARAVLLALIAAGLAWVLYRWVLRRTFVSMADRSMAVLLERRYPAFQDALVTSVELADRPEHAQPFSGPMLQETGAQALAAAASVRLRDVFHFRPLLRSLAAAAVLLASIAAFYAGNQEAMAVWVQRIYLLQDRPWPRQARVEAVGVELLGPDDAAAQWTDLPLVRFTDRRLKVARGSNVRLRVQADLGAKVVPDVCAVVYRTEDGDRGRVTMNRMNRSQGKYQHYSFAGKPLRGILATTHFDVIGYDDRLRDYTIEVVDSPALVGTELDCSFPAYMVDEQLASWLPRTVELTNATQLPRGTQLLVRGTANKPLRRVDLLNVDTGDTVTIPIEGNGNREFTFAVERLQANLNLEVTLRDVDDVVTERPQRIFVTCVPDEPPRVDVRLKGIGTAVTPDVMIPVEGSILDDYAVEETWFDVRIARGTGEAEEREPAASRQDFTLKPGGSVDDAIDFRAWRASPGGTALLAKDTLMLAVMATDRYDLLGEQPHTGSGERYQLDVVPPETLITMLEAQEIALRRRLERVIEEVTETRDLLHRTQSPELSRGTDPEDAARPRGEEPEDRDAEGDRGAEAKRQVESLQRIRSSIAEQSLQQCRKNAQELLGIATGFRDLREELINNRVDTEDRKRRLQELIADPLQSVVDQRFAQWEGEIDVLTRVLLDDLNARAYDLAVGQPQAAACVATADAILAELDQILQQMMDLETYNELLDIVRQLLEDQQQLIEKTTEERKRGLLQELQ